MPAASAGGLGMGGGGEQCRPPHSKGRGGDEDKENDKEDCEDG